MAQPSREKIARVMSTAQGVDPDHAVLVGFVTMRAWEARLPAADAILALFEDSASYEGEAC